MEAAIIHHMGINHILVYGQGTGLWLHIPCNLRATPKKSVDCGCLSLNVWGPLPKTMCIMAVYPCLLGATPGRGDKTLCLGKPSQKWRENKPSKSDKITPTQKGKKPFGTKMAQNKHRQGYYRFFGGGGNYYLDHAIGWVQAATLLGQTLCINMM